MPGPPKKPNPFKLISGTARPCRMSPEEPADTMPALGEVPEPPAWLPNAHAVKDWQRRAPLLVQNRTLRSSDVSTFAHLCAIHGVLCQLWCAGIAPTGFLLSQYAKYAQGFGLAYAWRRNTGEPGKRGPKTGFGKFKPGADEG
jgi:phage terminase small subunit